MSKDIINGITNDEKIIWYRLKPNLITVNLINEIAGVINKYYEGEGEIADELGPKIKHYKELILKRVSYRDEKGALFAIGIFNEDLVDFIVFKDSPYFKSVQKLVTEKFEFQKPLKNLKPKPTK